MTTLTAAVLGATLLAGGLAPPAEAATTSKRETALLAKINHARAAHGLVLLRPRAGLMRYAGRHSAAMAASHDLYHTTNFGVVCCWSAIGENIAYNASVRRVHRAFMGSPGHRANILNPSMRRVGVGIVKRGGRLWVTEIFTKPA